MKYELFPSELPINVTIDDATTIWPEGSTRSEIDLRKEMHNLLYGHGDELPKGQPGILRRNQVDSDGNLIVCPCVSETTNEPDIDTPCPVCFGNYYLFTEEWIVYYKEIIGRGDRKARSWEVHIPGNFNKSIAYFYLEYGVDPDIHDRIIEVERDVDGNVMYPLNRTGVFTIGAIEKMRSDNGRTEYYRVAALEDPKLSKWEFVD